MEEINAVYMRIPDHAAKEIKRLRNESYRYRQRAKAAEAELAELKVQFGVSE